MRGFQGSEPPARETPGTGHRPGNLPAELTTFIGRKQEVSEIKRQLARARLVTVTGVAGAGKSRCAIETARQLQERFSHGVWLVELAALRDSELLEHAVVEALGVVDQVPRPPLATLVEHLADRRLLLVLDGYDHLVAPCAEMVHELLRRAPRLRVLAAGRRPLGVAGERLCPLEPLSAPAPRPQPAARQDSAPLEVVAAAPVAAEDGDAAAELGEAAALFAERAAAVLPGFTVTAANRRQVAEVCHRLDGIPLAIELAASRLRTLSLDQILTRLDDRFRLLVGGSRGAPPHHQTLRTAVGWSHELCTPQERLLWARLSVFAGHFDLEAAEYVCSGPDLPAEEILDVLTELVAQSVVSREDAPSGVRYRMLGTLRAYGADWLEAGGEAERLRRRHRDWCTGLVTWCELEWFSPRQAEVALRINDEMPNLRAALECALEDEEDGRFGLYLAATLWFCWVGCGRLAEGRHWLDRALELSTDHEETRLKALWVAGYVAVLQGDTVAALTVLHECREGAERTGNARAAAYSTHLTGCIAMIGDEMQRAETLLRDAIDRYEKIGELNSNVLMARCELAMVIAFQGDLALAVGICEEVRQACEDHGEQWAKTYALYVLGFSAWHRGDTAAAKEMLHESLRVAHAFRDLVSTVQALELLAGITASEGDPVEAAVLQGAAGRLWRSVGMPLFGSEFFNAPHIHCERQVRERLGPARYRECLRQGERLDADAAVARVLYGRGRPSAVVSPRSEGERERLAVGESARRLPLPPAQRADDESAGGASQRA